MYIFSNAQLTQIEAMAYKNAGQIPLNYIEKAAILLNCPVFRWHSHVEKLYYVVKLYWRKTIAGFALFNKLG